ncbi:hypothetical protein ACWEPC_09495 [Nonomuraea sp. NPDC004297]
MLGDLKAERMPATARAGHALMTVQIVLSLVGLLFVAGVFLNAGSTLGLLLSLVGAAFTALQIWLVTRWPTRRKAVRRGVIALAALDCVFPLAGKTVDGDLSWTALPAPAVLFSVGTIVLLCTPSATRWFNR